MKKIIVMLLMGVLAAASQGVLIVHEGFDYTVGTTLTSIDGKGTDANGGTGWNGAWNNVRTDTNVAGLVSSLSATAGGGVGAASRVNVNNSGRTFDGAPYNVNGQVLWFSMIVSDFYANPTNNQRVMLFTSGSSSSGFGVEMQGTTTAPNYVAKIGGTLGTTLVTGDGSSDFILGRFVNNTAGTGGYDTLSLWLPTLAQLTAYKTSGDLADLGTAATASVVTGPVFGPTSGVLLRSNGPTTTYTLDELRIGTLIGDVAIPEPATIGMIGVGALVTLLIRRFGTR